MECTKIFVGSLPPATKPKELRHLFQEFGIVVECDVMNRCGFVHMGDAVMAQSAIDALNGSEFKGQTIVVEPGRAKEKKMTGPMGPPLKSPNMIMANVPRAGDQQNMNRNFSARGRGAGNGGMPGSNQRGGGIMNRGGRGGQRGAPSYRGGGFGRGHIAAANDSFGPIRNNNTFRPPRSVPYPRTSPLQMRGGGNFNSGAGRSPGFQRFGGQPSFDNTRDLQVQNFPKANMGGGFGSNFDDANYSDGFHSNPHSRNANNAPMKPNMAFSNGSGQDRRGFTLSSPPGRATQNSYHQQPQHQAFSVPPSNQRGNFHQSRGARGGHIQRGGNQGMHNAARPGQTPVKRQPPFNDDFRPNKMQSRNFSANSNNFNSEFPPLNGGGMMAPSHRGGFNNRGGAHHMNNAPFRGSMMRGQQRRFPMQ